MKYLLTVLLAATLAAAQAAPLPIEPIQPSFDGAAGWVNSPPLSFAQLRGKVVLVDFWTYSCINCLRTLPWLRAWSQKYATRGLVVVGVHAPEFGFEKQSRNVSRAARDQQLGYPVVLDNEFAIWRAFRNQAWPALYFVDALGRVRHHQFGEGNYEKAERVIQQLLAEAGAAPMSGSAQVAATGVGLAPDFDHIGSPETYLGHAHGAHAGLLRDRLKRYVVARPPGLNDWALSGDWIVRDEYAELAGDAGDVVMRFHARDLHLVLAPAPDGRPLPFRITLDGQPPGADAGVDVAADGRGTVTAERLYQLVRQRGPVRDRTFEIHFLAPGAKAYAFTFG